jgi:hypothetical protein
VDVVGYEGGRLEETYVNFYRAFGYLILRGMLGADEMRTFGVESRAAMGDRHDPGDFDPGAAAERDRRQWSLMMDTDTPFHTCKLEDPRFLTLAHQLCAEDVIGIKVQSNRFGGSTPWHRDTYTAKRGGIKFIWYHETVRRATGALRLVPASHLLGDNYLFSEKLVRLPVDEVPATALETDPGDVIVFDMRAWHGSFGGTERYASDLSYYNNPKTEEEEEALRLRAATNVKILLASFGGQQTYFYPRSWVADAERIEVRARWIRRLREVGYFDAPGVLEPETVLR